MVIWQIGFDPDTYQSLHFSSHTLDWMKDYWLNSFDGSSMVANWKQIDVHIDNSPGKIPGDFPTLLASTPPVFNLKALSILMPLIHNDIEILPLNSYPEKLYAINVIRVLDCLNKNRSQFKYFSDGKRVMRVEKYIFINECIDGVDMFKIPEQIKNRHYVSDRFKATVEQHGLRGMTFTKVYAG